MAGTESRKLNSAAASGSVRAHMAVVTVIPEREMPGNSARA